MLPDAGTENLSQESPPNEWLHFADGALLSEEYSSGTRGHAFSTFFTDQLGKGKQ